jgi:hypothetical protein
MNTFTKFLDLYRADSRYHLELAQGFLWYHCHSTGQKAADIATIQQYYREAGIAAPSARELADKFSSARSGVVSDGAQYRVRQDSARWYQDRFVVPVFEAGLPVFAVGVAPTPSDSRATRTQSRSRRLLHWAKDHPVAAWIMLVLAIASVALGLWPIIR